MKMKMKIFNNYNIIIMHYHKLILNNNKILSFNNENHKIMKEMKNENL